MNEQELSKLLYEAADHAPVSPTASLRVLRRTRMRMAATGTVALSFIALLAGGGFAVATRNAPGQPNLKPASPAVTPGPQESYLSFSTTDGIILAEVEDKDSLWAFTAEDSDDELCLYSTTHTEGAFGDVAPSGFGAASGIGDCVPLGVPDKRDVGFYMWDSGRERLEVLGALSTEVARLELQESNASDDVVTIIEAPDELGDDRNFFYLWLPMKEVGTLVAYDDAGNVLEESQLCFEPGAQAVSCTVGNLPDVWDPPLLPADLSMACDEISPGKIGRLSRESTPEQTMQRWIDSLDLDLTPDEFETEPIDSETLAMNLPAPKGASAVYAILSKKGDHQWSIIELLYCEGIVDPGSSKLPKGLPPPPKPPRAPPTPSRSP